jgi:hypothetical protein
MILAVQRPTQPLGYFAGLQFRNVGEAEQKSVFAPASEVLRGQRQGGEPACRRPAHHISIVALLGKARQQVHAAALQRELDLGAEGLGQGICKRLLCMCVRWGRR